MTKALVSGNGIFFEKLFSCLQTKFDWSICCWIVDENSVANAAHLFPRAHIVNVQALNSGSVASDPGVIFPPLDSALLGSLQWCEPIVFEMMNRIDSMKRLGYEERRRLYHFHIKYWSAVIEKKRPDVSFFPYAPHEVCDFVLFALCRHLQIPTMMFEWTSLPGYRFLIEDYRLMPVIKPHGLDQDAQPISSKISDVAETELHRLRQDYRRAMPGYFAASIAERDVVKPTLTQVLAKKIKRLRHVSSMLPYLRKRSARPLDFLYFQNPLQSELIPSSPTRLEDALHAFNVRDAFRLAQELYANFCVQPDLSEPYIYLALHFQPERTTCPVGGIFSDQRLVVDLLASCMPEGWTLYVKEHPSQFVASRYGYLARSPEFYLDIAAHKNVKFIAQNTPQFDLIDNCRAVATITGTSGWESLVRGRPALIFGDAWYQGCVGAHKIATLEQCKTAMAAVVARPTVADEDVRAFIAWVEKNAVSVYLGAEEASYDQKLFDEEKNIDICSREMVNFLDQLTSSLSVDVETVRQND